MNTRELIDCLNYCAKDETDCLGCERWEYDCGSARCVGNLMELAADRLAALEAELIDERYRHDRYADYTRGLEQKLAQAKAGSRWIPVTERLPEKSSYYLCYWKGHTHRCKFWRQYKRFEFNGRAMKVTHWMPLPEAPGEVEDG